MTKYLSNANPYIHQEVEIYNSQNPSNISSKNALISIPYKEKSLSLEDQVWYVYSSLMLTVPTIIVLGYMYNSLLNRISMKNPAQIR
jgi:hypothetical protein